MSGNPLTDIQIAMTRREEIKQMMVTDPDAVVDLLLAWEEEMSKEMPADFKDWWQNSREEWPSVARHVIQSLREREQLAWSMASMPPLWHF